VNMRGSTTRDSPAQEMAIRWARRTECLGLHDMHGNVWEWCRDCYADKLPGGRDPEVTEQDTEWVIRGGCVGFWLP